MNKNNVEAFKKYYANTTKEQVIEDMFLECCNLQNEIDRLIESLEKQRHFYLCKISKIQQENERLKQSLFKSVKNTNKSIELTEIYKSRCEKALHLIKHNDIYDYRVFEEKLKNILNGSDEK